MRQLVGLKGWLGDVHTQANPSSFALRTAIVASLLITCQEHYSVNKYSLPSFEKARFS